MRPDDHQPTKEFEVGNSDVDKCLTEKRTLFVAEGGVVYSGMFNGQPCLVTDEGTMTDFLPELGSILPQVQLFENEPHRRAFIAARGWADVLAYWRQDRLDVLRRQVEEVYVDGGLEAVERIELLSQLDGFAAGRPAGGLLARDHALLPQRFEYRTSHAFTGETLIEWNGEAFRERHQSFDPAWEPAHSRGEFQPTARQWRSFWRTLRRLGAWSWEGQVDQTTYPILDPACWSWNASYRGRSIDVHGISEDTCCAQLEPALDRLLAGWPA